MWRHKDSWNIGSAVLGNKAPQSQPTDIFRWIIVHTLNFKLKLRLSPPARGGLGLTGRPGPALLLRRGSSNTGIKQIFNGVCFHNFVLITTDERDELGAPPGGTGKGAGGRQGGHWQGEEGEGEMLYYRILKYGIIYTIYFDMYRCWCKVCRYCCFAKKSQWKFFIHPARQL